MKAQIIPLQMTLHRAFVATKWLEQAQANSEINLPSDVVHRLYKVVRVSKDELVELFDGQGLCVLGHVVSANAPHFRVESIEKRPQVGPRLILAQALVSQKKLEEIVQHCTEISADQFILFSARNSIAKVTNRNADQVERLNRIAVDAARQSERAEVPKVTGPFSFTELVSLLKAQDCVVLVGEPREKTRLVDVLLTIPKNQDIALVIGPEGGLTDDELKSLSDIGARSVCYAPHVLRTETAGLVGLSIIQSSIR